MFKKSFYLAAVFSTALFASCQHDPTVINSTWHKPGEGGNISHNSTNKENVNQNAANRTETNVEMKPATNAKQMSNSAKVVNKMVVSNTNR